MTKTEQWKWECRLRLSKGGHKIFRDARNDFLAPELRRWAIADNSGGCPDQTEDGVLWLDMSRPLEVAVGNEYWRCHIPVIVEQGGTQSRTGEDLDGFIALRQQFPKWEVKLDDQTARLLEALAPTELLHARAAKALSERAHVVSIQSRLALQDDLAALVAVSGELLEADRDDVRHAMYEGHTDALCADEGPRQVRRCENAWSAFKAVLGSIATKQPTAERRVIDAALAWLADGIYRNNSSGSLLDAVYALRTERTGETPEQIRATFGLKLDEPRLPGA